MGPWQLLTEGSVVATIMGFFLTVYALINNRTLKAEAKGIRDILLAEAQANRELLSRIERGQEETRREGVESRKDMAQTLADSRREMADAIKHVADLVTREGEATRAALRP
jgi:hypothetical protein